MDRERTRREFLRTGAALGVGATLAGCTGGGGGSTGGETTTEPTERATRTTTGSGTATTTTAAGSAPGDTPTSTDTDSGTAAPTTTTESATPSAPFETFNDGGFNGTVELGVDPLLRIDLDGSRATAGNHPQGGIVRREPMEPPFAVTFAGVSFARETVNNAINIGISAFRSPLFRRESRNPYASVRSEEGRAGPTEFVLELSAEARNVTVESDPFTVPADGTDVTIVYTGDRVRVRAGGSEVASLEYGIEETFYPAVALEDDADVTESSRLAVRSYAERDR